MNKIIGGLFLLASLAAAPPVSAGGQLVYLSADSQGSEDNGVYSRIIRISLHPEYPCKGTEITFKFLDSKEGDYITTASGGPTYVMTEDRQLTTCSTYAKFQSKALGERQVTVSVKNGNYKLNDDDNPVIKVHFDGKYYADSFYDSSYNGQNYRSSPEDPYRNFTANSSSSQPPSTNITVSPTSAPLTPVTVTPPAENNIVVEELNKKVESLQNQLEASKKQQSALEQRVNDLINFIKNLFPFFK